MRNCESNCSALRVETSRGSKAKKVSKVSRPKASSRVAASKDKASNPDKVNSRANKPANKGNRAKVASKVDSSKGRAKRVVSRRAAVSLARVSVPASSRVARPAGRADLTAIASVLVNRAFTVQAIAFRTRGR